MLVANYLANILFYKNVKDKKYLHFLMMNTKISFFILSKDSKAIVKMMAFLTNFSWVPRLTYLLKNYFKSLDLTNSSKINKIRQKKMHPYRIPPK